MKRRGADKSQNEHIFTCVCVTEVIVGDCKCVCVCVCVRTREYESLLLAHVQSPGVRACMCKHVCVCTGGGGPCRCTWKGVLVCVQVCFHTPDGRLRNLRQITTSLKFSIEKK